MSRLQKGKQGGKPTDVEMSSASADKLTVAYFSMEFGIDPAMPPYSGGLGILAGDSLRAAADLGLPAVGMTLLHRKGYFRQRLDKDGNQSESDSSWSPEGFLKLLALRALVTIGGAAWRGSRKRRANT